MFFISIVNTVFKAKDRLWELIYWNWAYYSVIINWTKSVSALGHASVAANHISSSNPLHKCLQRAQSNSCGLGAWQSTVLHQENLTLGGAVYSIERHAYIECLMWPFPFLLTEYIKNLTQTSVRYESQEEDLHKNHQPTGAVKWWLYNPCRDNSWF